MGNAYGFVEIQGVVAALDALDIMCKTADVALAAWERKLGGRLVTLVVEGGLKRPVASGVLASPHAEIVRLVQLSASRFNDKGAQA